MNQYSTIVRIEHGIGAVVLMRSPAQAWGIEPWNACQERTIGTSETCSDGLILERIQKRLAISVETELVHDTPEVRVSRPSEY